MLPAQEISSRHKTANTEAYRQYLLGNQFRLADVPDSNRQALAAYQKAIGSTQATPLPTAASLKPNGVLPTKPRAKQRLISAQRPPQKRPSALAPDSPEGYWARSKLRAYYSFDWTGAQADNEHALALDPNYARGAD